MKIRFVHQYFHPDLSSVSQILSQIAFDLGEKGVSVSVLCSHNKYDGDHGGRVPTRETIRGVEIFRCWGPSVGRHSIFGRLVDISSFCILSALRLFLSPGADTTVFLTNPPFYSCLGPVLKKMRGGKFVYIMMDVYPDVAIQSGILKEGSVATRILRRIARFALRGADRIVVLGDDMREVATRSGAPAESVVVIRNWVDPEKVFPVPPENNHYRREWGLEGKFVVEYSGNFGISHVFDDLLAVAEELSDHEQIRFLFIGRGVRRKEVERFVASRKLTNVILLPYQETAALAQSLSAGDVHYVSLRPGFEGLVVPSKTYGIMSAGRPVIYQGNENGEIAQMILRERIGVVVEPGNQNRLRSEILSLYRDRGQRMRMGETARRVLIEKYSNAVGLSDYREVLAGLR